jgi:hypothetical protein
VIEILVAAACVVVAAPVLYVTLKACSMALRGEPIGEPKQQQQRYCMKCRWFQESQTLVSKSDRTKKFTGDWCDLLRTDDPVRKNNGSHDCKHWKAKKK